MSKEASAAVTAQVVPAVKASPQFARLRVAETDETSISGEELYTDGSSDEDNCRCKNSPSKDWVKDSSVTLARLARSKGKLVGKKPISDSHQSSGESQEVEQDESSYGQSALTDSLGASDEDESLDDDEISWKVNREEKIMIKNEMIAIEKYREEYPKICDSVDSIFDQYFQQLMNVEQVDNEIFVKGKEKLKDDLMNSVQFLDTTMEKIMNKLEQIKKKTRHIQLQNRLRLKEILKNSPTTSAKLAENTKRFFDLYSDKGLTDTSESCQTEISNDIEKSNVCKALCD